MQFGVTFYPDQYPKEIWEKEFSEIKKTGFSVVRFLEMAWDFIEPKDNRFTFDNLDRALALCEKYKLKVLLGVPVSQAPQWLVKKHPEILNIANDGFIHPSYGPRPNACRDNKTFKKYAERLTRKLARRYAKNKAVYMWQIDNEPTYPPLDLIDNSRDYCHCGETAKAFRIWAKAKYKTIENLNNAWGTKFWTGTFSDFLEITPPRSGMWDAVNPHIYLDWIRFKSESISSWLKALKKIIREYDAEHKIGTNSFTTILPRSVDHRTIAEGMDWFGWDIYPKGTQNSEESLAQIADYWRSVCRASGAEFIVSELQGGPNVRWGSGEEVTGKDIKAWVKLLAEHGAKLILFHNWRPPLFGSETGGFGLTNPDGTPTERLKTVKEIIREHKTSNFSALGGQTSKKISIYYSRSSDIQTYQEEGPARSCPPGWFSGRGDLGMFYGNNSIAGAYRLCWEKGVRPDFIFEKDLESAVPSCKTILLTNPYLLSGKQFENLMSFVKNGGTLISECRFGLKDEHAHLYERPLLEELFGDGIKANSITQKKLGKGKMIYANFSLFSEILLGNIYGKIRLF